MSIMPLPVFEADADPRRRDAMTDAELYASLEVPKTLVIRYGRMKMIAELPYDGDVKPGCGTKLVARTPRGTEIAEMLTTTCTNAGCGKSVTRKEMLEYIDNSGGRDFPFTTKGRVLRVATVEDLNSQEVLLTRVPEWVKFAKALINERRLPMKLVEIEPILGMESLTLYYMSEDRIDFRDLVKDLAAEFQTRIEMRQVGARDEARLVADYERCGQHCCCKNFLKVLKPISMRAAKMQKATLDPLKISGRCGRLMCCLRYEDATYKELKSQLPHRKTRVGTPYGVGIVLDGKILAQLVLVQLEHNGEEVAVPVEALMPPEEAPSPEEIAVKQRAGLNLEDPLRGLSAEQVGRRAGLTDEASSETETKREPREERGKRRRGRGRGHAKDEQRDTPGTSDASSRHARQDGYRERSRSFDPDAPPPPDSSDAPDVADSSDFSNLPDDAAGAPVSPSRTKDAGDPPRDRDNQRKRRRRGGRGRRRDGAPERGGNAGRGTKPERGEPTSRPPGGETRPPREGTAPGTPGTPGSPGSAGGGGGERRKRRRGGRGRRKPGDGGGGGPSSEQG